MHIKLVSFLRFIVSSCIAELDLFRLTCNTFIFLPFSRDSGIAGARQGWMLQWILGSDGCLPGEDVCGVQVGIGAAADQGLVEVFHEAGVGDGCLAVVTALSVLFWSQ